MSRLEISMYFSITNLVTHKFIACTAAVSAVCVSRVISPDGGFEADFELSVVLALQ